MDILTFDSNIHYKLNETHKFLNSRLREISYKYFIKKQNLQYFQKFKQMQTQKHQNLCQNPLCHCPLNNCRCKQCKCTQQKNCTNETQDPNRNIFSQDNLDEQNQTNFCLRINSRMEEQILRQSKLENGRVLVTKQTLQNGKVKCIDQYIKCPKNFDHIQQNKKELSSKYGISD